MEVFLVRLMLIAVWTCILAMSARIFIRRLKFLGLSKARKDNLPKWSTQQKPTIGGLIFFTAFLLYNVFQDLPFFDFTWKKIGFCMLGSMAFFIGLWDDLKVLKPKGKLMLQIILALSALLFGLKLSITHMEWLNIVITFFLIIGLMNSVNMLDNMDATATLGVLPFFAFCLLSGCEIGMAIFFLAAIFAFLIFNFPPAKIYMGDSGSMLIGCVMAMLLCRISCDEEWKEDKISFGIQIISLLLIPMADTMLVVIQRLRHRISPMQGGKDHSTHHLHYAGLSERAIAGVLFMSAAVQCFLALAIYNAESKMEKIVYGVLTLLYTIAYGFAHYFNSLRNLKNGKYSYIHE